MADELQLLTPPPAPSAELANALLYSSDGRYVFQRQAHVLRVLHARSGRVLHECVRKTKSPLRTLALHPHNALQVLAGYEDGLILVWDFVEQKPLVEINVVKPVLWIGSGLTHPSQLLLVLEQGQGPPETRGWKLMELSLKTLEQGPPIMRHFLPFHAAAMHSYMNNPQIQGDYVVLTSGDMIFAILFPPKRDGVPRRYFIQRLQHIRPVTCVSVNPFRKEFAIGDKLGQIFRFFQLAPVHDVGVGARLHWHPHSVHCVTYSRDGQYLFSGGEECVLVSWHLESGRRAYLPRLPSAVESIAPRLDGGVYVVGLADNVLFQYNPVTREQEWEARGLALAGGSARNALPIPQIAMDPNSRALVLNGSSGVGVLQFYEPFADRVLQTLLLSERNYVARTENEAMPVLRASHTCFSSNGRELITLHAPTTSKSGEDQSLRFWTRRVDGSFFVNTSVDSPHGRARVNRVVFSPTDIADCAVTADRHGDFNIWRKTMATDGVWSWSCQSVVRFRDEPITAVAFAGDGSLLAVAYGNKLSLWDVASHSLRRVIPSADGQAIRQIVFPGASSPFVVLLTDGQVQVWNLLTLSLWWRYAVPKGAVLAERPIFERFLIWMPLEETDDKPKRSLVLVFDPQTPVPLCVRAVDVGCQLWAAGFHPGTGDIVLVDMKTGIWRLDGPDAHSTDFQRRKDAHIAAVKARPVPMDEEQEAQALSAMYNAASNSKTAKKPVKGKHVAGRPAAGPAANGLFDAPAHVLPSMTSLYRPFMDSMLPKPHKVTVGESFKDEGATASKKTKRRSKTHKQEVVEDPASKESGERKRMKLQAEKELANPALQQQTYSKLLKTFSKARRG